MVSAIDKVGSKEEPTDLGGGVSIFADNVLVELNIPPVIGLLQFISQLQKSLKLAVQHVYPKQLMLKSSLQFPLTELEDLRAFVFGCSPEYNVWDLDDEFRARRVAPPVIRPGNTFRSCGGHIHIGHQFALKDPVLVVKSLDLMVGVTGILLDKDPTSGARRKIYGGAGHYRPTEYGLEYRTPSAFWLASPGHATVIYRLVDIALRWYDQRMPDGEYRDIINSHDRKRAEHVFRRDVMPILMEEEAYALYDAICDLATTDAPWFYKAWGLDKALDRVAQRT